jgi:ribosomal protein L11 methyltransferase
MSGCQISLVVAKEETDTVELALASMAPVDEPPGLSSFEIPGELEWQVDAYFPDQPTNDQLTQALAGYHYDVRPAPDIDWVAQSLTHHQQVEAGRFHVYGSHHETPHKGGVNIKIDAGMAFGTGQHETTLGCLLAIDEAAKFRPLNNTLDLGCGTGILALTLAHVATKQVTASDIDPVAIDVARQNAQVNFLQGKIDFLVSAGLHHRDLGDKAPYDLIVANILAKPLCQMAPDISGAVAVGGTLILSGLLTVQEQSVLKAYRKQGLSFKKRYVIGEWSTLVLEHKA